jgi:hypothetical protein
MSGVDDVQTDGKIHKGPHTAHNPIPTVQKYREEKQERQAEYGTADGGADEQQESKLDRLGDAYTTLRHGKETANPDEQTQPYNAENKNIGQPNTDVADDHAGRVGQDKDSQNEDGDGDTTEGMLASAQDPKKARKEMKKFSADGTEREVTDPVTHLPVKIHDFTDKDLKSTPKNGPPAGQEPKSATGAANRDKDDEQLKQEGQESQDGYTAMEPLFPPPEFQKTREEITDVYKKAITAGLGIISGSLTLVVAVFQLTRHSTGISRTVFTVVEIATCIAASAGIIVFMRQYTEKRIESIWETEVWQAERQKGRKMAKSQIAESAQWLNSLLASVWPLINPDLFTSISDTLEDVMQASLPRMVRMVSVEDFGQGSESFRILGVRWLPTGAAARSVSQDGSLKSSGEEKNDRTVSGQGEIEKDTKDNNENDTGGDENVEQGMEAEEGEFVNVEIAFAYRPSAGAKQIKERAKSAHLYLAFYLPSNVKLRKLQFLSLHFQLEASWQTHYSPYPS